MKLSTHRETVKKPDNRMYDTLSWYGMSYYVSSHFNDLSLFQKSLNRQMRAKCRHDLSRYGVESIDVDLVGRRVVAHFHGSSTFVVNF